MKIVTPLVTFALGTVTGLILKTPAAKVVIKSAIRGVIGVQQTVSALAAEVKEEIEDEAAAMREERAAESRPVRIFRVSFDAKCP